MNNVTPLHLPRDRNDDAGVRHADIIFRSDRAIEAFTESFSTYNLHRKRQPALLAALNTLNLIQHEFPSVVATGAPSLHDAMGITLVTSVPPDFDLCGRCGAPSR